MDYENASLETRRIFYVAELFGTLHRTASALFALYDQSGDALNACQPANVPSVVPMSLDEWALELGECADEWRAIAIEALHNEARERDKAATIRAWESRGFAWEFPGYLARYFDNGARVQLSDADGSGLPEKDNWTVTLYPPEWGDTSAPLDMRSTGEAGPIGFDAALAAAIAGAESFPPSAE